MPPLGRLGSAGWPVGGGKGGLLVEGWAGRANGDLIWEGGGGGCMSSSPSSKMGASSASAETAASMRLLKLKFGLAVVVQFAEMVPGCTCQGGTFHISSGQQIGGMANRTCRSMWGRVYRGHVNLHCITLLPIAFLVRGIRTPVPRVSAMCRLGGVGDGSWKRASTYHVLPLPSCTCVSVGWLVKGGSFRG
jgi:hypothetical protein